jgi:hypothetical protein
MPDAYREAHAAAERDLAGFDEAGCAVEQNGLVQIEARQVDLPQAQQQCGQYDAGRAGPPRGRSRQRW